MATRCKAVENFEGYGCVLREGHGGDHVFANDPVPAAPARADEPCGDKDRYSDKVCVRPRGHSGDHSEVPVPLSTATERLGEEPLEDDAEKGFAERLGYLDTPPSSPERERAQDDWKGALVRNIDKAAEIREDAMNMRPWSLDQESMTHDFIHAQMWKHRAEIAALLRLEAELLALRAQMATARELLRDVSEIPIAELSSTDKLICEYCNAEWVGAPKDHPRTNELCFVYRAFSFLAETGGE